MIFLIFSYAVSSFVRLVTVRVEEKKKQKHENMSVKTPATSLQLKNEETPHPPFLCHSFLLSHSVPEIKSHQPFSNSPPSYTLS